VSVALTKDIRDIKCNRCFMPRVAEAKFRGLMIHWGCKWRSPHIGMDEVDHNLRISLLILRMPIGLPTRRNRRENEVDKGRAYVARRWRVVRGCRSIVVFELVLTSGWADE
jgi:hypothetical protein